MRSRKSLGVWSLAMVLTLGLGVNAAQAHDYWLEFSPLQPTPGAEVAVSLWVGEDLVPLEQKVMQTARTVRWQRVHQAGSEDLLEAAKDGQKPVLRQAFTEAGGHLLALERDISKISLRARKFNRYLEHEGLTAIVAERRKLGERWRRGRERYSRYLKAFVQVGDTIDEVSTKVLGHRLELVPVHDLAAMKAGDRLLVQVYFEGRPLSGIQVEAFVRGPGGAVRTQVATSDGSGRVEFDANTPGAWLVRTVHMQRCVGCEAIEWESFWAAYSFALPATRAARN